MFTFSIITSINRYFKSFQSDLLDANKLASLLYGYVPKILLEPFIEYVLSQEYTTFISLIVSSVFLFI
ncbi:hypothetical protein SD457_15060 [Coprobacillaceae bacterium CR2/5/TPMF4]|nr:hypothetical protein SD457_15060 [Coprobacillaceae bacterium CR2/5/TPMF4]